MQIREELNETNTGRYCVEVKINKLTTTWFFSDLGTDMTIITARQHTKEMGRIHPTTGRLRLYGSSNYLIVKGDSMTNSSGHTIITDIFIVEWWSYCWEDTAATGLGLYRQRQHAQQEDHPGYH